MLKKGKSYIVKVLDHFSGSDLVIPMPQGFKFKGKYVLSTEVYSVFHLEESLEEDASFLLQSAPKNGQFWYILNGMFEVLL